MESSFDSSSVWEPGHERRNLYKNYVFCGSCIDDVRTQLDKLGHRPLLTDHEIDQEVYPLKLAKGFG
jgi:hypothetical protein